MYRIVLLMNLLFMSSTFAANWYVDNQANGSNSGTSWANAWKCFSHIDWGTDGIQAGDILFISGGTSSKTYNESLIIGNSGTNDNRIIIKAGQETGHNGIVIINGQDVRNNCIFVPNYVSIDGEFNGQIRIICENSVQDGIRSQGNSRGISIRYLEIKDCGNSHGTDGIELREPQNCIVEYCNIHGSYQNGLKMTASKGTWGSNIIRYNEIYNNSDDGISARNGLDIYGNKIHYNGIIYETGHPDGIQTMGNYLRIYNNELWDNKVDNIILSFDNTHSGHVYIYNNIFYQTNATISAAPYSRGVNVRSTSNPRTIEDVLISNNVFIDLNFSAIMINLNSNTAISGNGTVQIKNNIIYNCRLGNNVVVIDAGSEGTYDENSVVIDYNLINKGPNGCDIIHWRGSNYTSEQFDSHGLGQQHGITGNPAFVSFVQYGANNNYHLTANSQAIGNGTNLSLYYDTDYDGRVHGDVWDIGAYKFIVLTPPEKLRFKRY